MFWVKKIIWILGISMLLQGIIGSVHQTVLQKGIAEEVLRFHVLANSDSQKDQEVKLAVRDKILEWSAVQTAEKGIEQREEMKLFLESNLEKIEKTASAVVRENGQEYEVRAEIQTCYFPDRTYGSCTFPAGWYEALRIELGAAEGRNWWCVFFPKLCFADCLHLVTEEEPERMLEEVLTAEEYEALLRSPKEWKIGFRWLKKAAEQS